MIQLESNNECVDLHIDVEYQQTRLHFESIKLKHLEAVYTNLDSQPIVRSKFGDGKVRTLTQTTDKVKDLSGKYRVIDKQCKPKGANPYSALIVTDADIDTFLGMTQFFEQGDPPGTAGIGRLNITDSWSHLPQEIVKTYAGEKNPEYKTYKGLGTAETCTMLQYAKFLKDRKYKICGHDLEAVVATARIDNPGSWRSNAKAGMKCYGITSNPNYGPEPRYQLRKEIP